MSDGHSLQTLTAGDFRGNLGTRFLLTAAPRADGTVVSFEIELAEVSEPAVAVPGTYRPPFSVLFHGPLEPVLPQAIYRLENERLGVFELFMVPIGPADPPAPGQAPAAMRYEVVFG